jgi:hypothetical protein
MESPSHLLNLEISDVSIACFYARRRGVFYRSHMCDPGLDHIRKAERANQPFRPSLFYYISFLVPDHIIQNQMRQNHQRVLAHARVVVFQAVVHVRCPRLYCIWKAEREVSERNDDVGAQARIGRAL